LFSVFIVILFYVVLRILNDRISAGYFKEHFLEGQDEMTELSDIVFFDLVSF